MARAVGAGILWAAPGLMKLLSLAGTAAMFLVGGGILVHGWPQLQSLITRAAETLGAGMQTLLPLAADALVGILAGAIVLAGVRGVMLLRRAVARA